LNMIVNQQSMILEHKMKNALETLELLQRNLSLNGISVYDYREDWKEAIFEAIEELKKDSLKFDKYENDIKILRDWVHKLSDELDRQ